MVDTTTTFMKPTLAFPQNPINSVSHSGLDDSTEDLSWDTEQCNASVVITILVGTFLVQRDGKLLCPVFWNPLLLPHYRSQARKPLHHSVTTKLEQLCGNAI